MRGLGVQKGDKVALLSKDRKEFAATYRGLVQNRGSDGSAELQMRCQRIGIYAYGLWSQGVGI